jgi:hypothetical protein
MLTASRDRSENRLHTRQSRLVTDLSEAATSGRESLIGLLRHHLAFASSVELDPEIERHYDDLDGDPEHTTDATRQLIRAGLGVYLFCHYAERWGRSRESDDQDDQALANDLLRDPQVRELLFDLYELDGQYRDDDVALHETGTTSFILRLEAMGIAVKIIKPWYFDDDDIAEGTWSYKDRYGLLRLVIPGHVAGIHASNRHCIVMDFIEGITLRKWFGDSAFEAISDPDAPPLPCSLVSVLMGICSLLGRCAAHTPPIRHGDLLATNVLIQPSTGTLFLIDFGTNYLRSRPVGTAEQRSEGAFLLSEREYQHGANGDVFRLGRLLAEGLLDDDFANVDKQTIVDAVYDRYLQLGTFLDDLFHRIAQPGPPAFPLEASTYDALSNQIREQFAGQAVAERAKRRRRLWILDDLSRVVSPINVTQTASLLLGLLGRSSRGERRGKEAPLVMRNLTWVPVLLNWFAIGLFIFMVGSHAGDRVWPEIIGWTCTLAYSIIAARYCVFVFSDLDLSDWPGWAPVSVPAMCLLIWPPILYPLVVDWRGWALCVALGTAIIAVNNEVCVRSSRKAIAASGVDVSRGMANAERYLVDWRQQMALFSVSIFVLSVLLWRDVLRDGLFYGVVVAVAPAVKMYIQQTRKEAPIVNAGLHRIANAYRRAGRPAET